MVISKDIASLVVIDQRSNHIHVHQEQINCWTLSVSPIEVEVVILSCKRVVQSHVLLVLVKLSGHNGLKHPRKDVVTCEVRRVLYNH